MTHSKALPHQPPALIVAAAGSGSGKTTFTIGLLEELRLRGYNVQPFKAGPDYIDTGLHSAVLSRPSYNLDTWMMGPDQARRTFATRSAGADVSVVEGVMGLFDGRGGSLTEGSTAGLAALLGIPVLLVVNAEKAAGSVAAVVRGFEGFEPGVDVRWVVVNRVSGGRGGRHYGMIKAAIDKKCSARVVGCMGRDPALVLPERHLGLTTSADVGGRKLKGFARAAARAVEEGVDVDALLAGLGVKARRRKGTRPAGRAIGKTPSAGNTRPAGAVDKKVRIAIARDRAFSFYYEENLELLASLGAELVSFSPVSSKRLPRNVAGIYLGGGYPELHAERLSANATLIEDIRAASKAGMPIYAECGGLVYLGRSVTSPDGARSAMAGVFPWAARMLAKRAALGYREVTTTDGCPFVPPGLKVRGHEYHYTTLSKAALRVPTVFDVIGIGAKKTPEGYLRNNTLASYIHLHFASNPAFAMGFVDAARAFRG